MLDDKTLDKLMSKLWLCWMVKARGMKPGTRIKVNLTIQGLIPGMQQAEGQKIRKHEEPYAAVGFRFSPFVSVLSIVGLR